jgi:hypothetical protein
VKLPFGKKAPSSAPQRSGGFAEWLLGQFSGGRPTSGMPYAEVERICANAGSLLVGAAYAAPARFHGYVYPGLEPAREAELISRRTADGFKASLADRKNVVIAWPWDHMATAVAWQATRAHDTSERALGLALLDIGTAYAARHRDQVTAVLDLWRQVAAGVQKTQEAPDLAGMGVQMLDAFDAFDAIEAAAAGRGAGG